MDMHPMEMWRIVDGYRAEALGLLAHTTMREDTALRIIKAYPRLVSYSDHLRIYARGYVEDDPRDDMGTMGADYYLDKATRKYDNAQKYVTRNLRGIIAL